jgi:hypothetical protein
MSGSESSQNQSHQRAGERRTMANSSEPVRVTSAALSRRPLAQSSSQAGQRSTESP